MKAANLGLRFLLELCALAALAYWGIEAGSTTAGKVALAVAAPGVFIVLWGMWIAPRAPRRLADPERLAAELVLFGAAIVALAVAGEVILALVFALVLALNSVLLLAWDQRQIA